MSRIRSWESAAMLRRALRVAIAGAILVAACAVPGPLGTVGGGDGGDGGGGGGGGDGGGDGGGGSPTIDVNEPIYEEGQGSVIFYDGFEGFSSSAELVTWQAVVPGRWAIKEGSEPSVQLATSGARVGSKAARFTYSSSSSQQDLLLEATQTSALNPNVVVVTWWMRTESGYEWFSGVGQGGQAHKIFVANIGGVGQGERILLQIAADGLIPDDLRSCYPAADGILSPTWSIANVLYKQNVNYPAWRADVQGNDGAWHRWTLRVTKSTSRPTVDRGNGRLEMWVDGVKLMEYIGDDPARCEAGKVNIPTTRLVPDLHFPSVNGAVPVQQWLEFDDMRVWTP